VESEKDLSLLGISKNYKDFLSGVLKNISGLAPGADEKKLTETKKYVDIEEAHEILDFFFSERPDPYLVEVHEVPKAGRRGAKSKSLLPGIDSWRCKGVGWGGGEKEGWRRYRGQGGAGRRMSGGSSPYFF
jgi:hypothetical protein